MSGLAALSWEIVWQIKATLATMGGMCVGSLLMGSALRNKTIARPVRLYGALELGIGLSGLLLDLSFRLIGRFDTWAYLAAPGTAGLAYSLAIAAALGVPTVCMGATLPVLGVVSQRFRTSLATLYGLNTLGAAAGTLLAAFVVIPLFGITHTAWIIAAVNIAVGVSTWASVRDENGVLAGVRHGVCDFRP